VEKKPTGAVISQRRPATKTARQNNSLRSVQNIIFKVGFWTEFWLDSLFSRLSDLEISEPATLEAGASPGVIGCGFCGSCDYGETVPKLGEKY